MKAQLEPVVLTNAVVSVLLFSMLTLGMSTKISDVNLLQTWADAGSFANSISSRAYTSADCFAYESGLVTEYEGEIISERRVYPGVIDVRKFTDDNYFSCIESYYSTRGSEIDYMSKNVPMFSVFLINFKLYDLEDPQMIRDLGDTISNQNQLDWSKSFDFIDSFQASIIDLQWKLDVLSIVMSIGISIITAPMGLPVNVDFAFRVGDLNSLNYIDKSVVDYLSETYSSHTSTIPITLRYVDENGEWIKDHQGILKTVVKYDAGAL